MRNNASLLYTLMLVVGDFLAILSAFVTAYIIRIKIDTRPLVAEITAAQYLEIFLTLLPFWLIVFAALNLYRREVFEQKIPETLRLLIGSFIGILLMIGWEFVSEESVFPARLIAIYGLIGSFGLLFIERTILRWLRKKLFQFNLGVQRVMLIGSTSATTTLAKLLNNTARSGYDILAVVGNKNIAPEGFAGRHYSDLNQALRQIERLNVNTIIQTEFFDDEDKNHKILRTAQNQHIAYRFIPTQGEFFTGNHSVELFHGFPVIAVHQTRLFGWQRIGKRLFDLFLALLALPFILVCYLIFGIIIKLTDWRGPVFYRQTRVTRFGTEFKAFKFRTLYWKYSVQPGKKSKTDEQIFKSMGRDDLAEKVASGDMQVKNDPRVMPIGRLLRATSLDELPQFLNVFNGEMSVVGPRAITPKDMNLYKELGSQLLYVKTGITGLAQVSGRSDLSYEERTKLNLYYVQNWSFLMDLRIVLRTIWVILTSSGSR